MNLSEPLISEGDLRRILSSNVSQERSSSDKRRHAKIYWVMQDRLVVLVVV